MVSLHRFISGNVLQKGWIFRIFLTELETVNRPVITHQDSLGILWGFFEDSLRILWGFFGDSSCDSLWDSPGFLSIHFGESLRFFGILWRCWEILCDSFWDSTDIFRDSLGLFGILWDFLWFFEFSRGFYGILRGFFEILRHSSRRCGILWIFEAILGDFPGFSRMPQRFLRWILQHAPLNSNRHSLPPPKMALV